MTPAVRSGLAVAVFLYYNWMGFREQGVGRYLVHFAGPMPSLAPLMIPIEFISHLARPLSLTIRLYANMFAGEKVTMTFLSLTYFALARRLHGPARLRRIFTGFYFYAARHDLRRRSSGARTLMALSVPSVSPPSPRADREPPPREQFLYKENTHMTRKIDFSGRSIPDAAGQPDFRPNPRRRRNETGICRSLISPWASLPACAAWGREKPSLRPPKAMARNPGAAAGIRFALILGLVLIESLALYTLVITYVAK